MPTPENPSPEAPEAAPGASPAADASRAVVPPEGAPADVGAVDPAGAEAEAWARVLAGWEDEAAHREYLGRFSDLEGLAVAGGRYRAVLADRPGDAVAARYRDEVVKRATVQGLALLPRTVPRPPGRLKRAIYLAVVLALGAAAAWAAFRLAVLLVRSPA